METGFGVLKYTEEILNTISKEHPHITYKVNKINILVKNNITNTSILDIYGRIKNDEIRISINGTDSPEYMNYLKLEPDLINENRNQIDSKGHLNFSFYVPRNIIKTVLYGLLGIGQ